MGGRPSTTVPSSAPGPSPGVTPSSGDILAETVDQAVHYLLDALAARNVISTAMDVTSPHHTSPPTTHTAASTVPTAPSISSSAATPSSEWITAVTQAAHFLLHSLVSAAQRAQEAKAFLARITALRAAGIPQPPISAAPAPSLVQWVQALESLVSGAVPAILRCLSMFFVRGGEGCVGSALSPSQLSSSPLQQCGQVLVNLLYAILTAHQQTVDELQLARRRLRQLTSSDATVQQFLSTADYHAEHRRQESQRLEELQQRLGGVHATLRSALSRHLMLLVWCAEHDLWLIHTKAVVVVQGLPNLRHLPQTPLYLSPYDGFIWLLVHTTLYEMLPTQLTLPPSVAHPPHAPGESTPSGSGSRIASPLRPSSTTFGFSTRRGHTAVTGTASATTTAASTRPSTPTGAHRRHANGERDTLASQWLPSVPDVTPTVDSGSRVRSGLTATLLQWRKLQRPEDDVGEKGEQEGRWRDEGFNENAEHGERAGENRLSRTVVSIVLASLAVYLRQWTRQRSVLYHIVQAWATRGTSMATTVVPSDGFYEDLQRELVNEELFDDIVRLVVTVDELVVHRAELFLQSARLFLQLFTELLMPLVFLRYYATAYLLSVQRRYSSEEEDAFPLSGSHPALKSLTTLLGRLYSHVEVYLLDPIAEDPDAMQLLQLPPQASVLLLQVGVLCMVCDGTEQHSRTEANSPVSSAATPSTASRGGALRGASDAVHRRQQWRSWAVWMRAAHEVCEADVLQQECPSAEDSAKRERYDAIFLQSLCVVLEDVYALSILLSKLTEPQHDAAATAVQVAGLGPSHPTQSDLMAEVNGGREKEGDGARAGASPSTRPSTARARASTASRALPYRLDEICGSVYASLRRFLVHLHEESPEAVGVTAALLHPLHHLSDSSFAALQHVLTRFAEATRGASALTTLMALQEQRAAAAGRARATAMTASAPYCFGGGGGGQLPMATLSGFPVLQSAGAPQETELIAAASTAHRAYWLLAITYLRLSDLDVEVNTEGDALAALLSGQSAASPEAAVHASGSEAGEWVEDSGQPGEGRSYPSWCNDFGCCGPAESVAFLRDRSYECCEDWTRGQVADALPHRHVAEDTSDRGLVTDVTLQDLAVRFSLQKVGELRDAKSNLQDQLLMASVRFLTLAIHTAYRTCPPSSARNRLSAETLLLNAASNPSCIMGSAATASQAAVYVEAFLRFLLMMRGVPASRVVAVSRALVNELYEEETALEAAEAEERNHVMEGSYATGGAGSAAVPPLSSHSVLTEADLQAASSFHMEVSLFAL